MGDTSMPDLLGVMVKASASFPALFSLVQVLTTLVGVVMFTSSLVDLYNHNNEGRYAGPRKTMGSICMSLGVSTVLISSVYMLVVVGNTLVGSSAAGSALLYGSSGLNETQLAAVHAVMGLFMLGGYIWFIHGWMLLNKHFSGGREGVWGPILHIGAGAVLVYIEVWLPPTMAWLGLSNILLF